MGSLFPAEQVEAALAARAFEFMQEEAETETPFVPAPSFPVLLRILIRLSRFEWRSSQNSFQRHIQPDTFDMTIG